MRTIDGDALRDRLQNLGYEDWNQGTTTTWAEAFLECADMVDEQPTIEPEPKWKRLMMHLADLQLTYSPNWGANGCGDQKLYEFVTGLIDELQGWEEGGQE